MKAIEMDVAAGPEGLKVVDVPAPKPAPGEVLVRVRAAGVNYMDLMRVSGMPFDVPTPVPFTPGAEIAGEVVELGAGVDSLTVGSLVFGASGRLLDGGWAELAVANAAALTLVPEGVKVEQAAALTVVGAGAAIMLIEAARVTAEETVFVPAAGAASADTRSRSRSSSVRL